MSAAAALDESAPVSLREARPSDLAFVRSNWIRTLDGSPMVAGLGGAYLSRWGAVVEELFANSMTMVATVPEDPDTLLAFMTGDPARGVLHYAFTKPHFRRRGVSLRLFLAMFGEHRSVFFTHRTGIEKAITLAHVGFRFDFTRIWLP